MVRLMGERPIKSQLCRSHPELLGETPIKSRSYLDGIKGERWIGEINGRETRSNRSYAAATPNYWERDPE